MSTSTVVMPKIAQHHFLLDTTDKEYHFACSVKTHHILMRMHQRHLANFAYADHFGIIRKVHA